MGQLDPQRTALVIIDVQNGILSHAEGPRGDAARRNLDATIDRIAGILDRARKGGFPVFHVQHKGLPGERIEFGTEGWHIRVELTPADGEPVIHKTACDSFYETELEALLRARGIDRVIVAGCMTQFCIDTSVRRAVSLGFDVSLAADGHATCDMGALSFEAIIAHHNGLLNGFDAGSRAVSVVPSAALP